MASSLKEASHNILHFTDSLPGRKTQFPLLFFNQKAHFHVDNVNLQLKKYIFVSIISYVTQANMASLDRIAQIKQQVDCYSLASTIEMTKQLPNNQYKKKKKKRSK